MKTFLNYWPWEGPALRLLVRVGVMAPVAIGCAVLPFAAPKVAYAWWAVGFAAFLFRLVYGAVGKKVNALAASLAETDGQGAQSLLVNGMIQSPGLAFLHGDQIILAPIVGERVAIPIADIESVQETQWFNGKAVPGKVGLWFTVPGRKRLGAAMAYGPAAAWRKRFQD